MDILTPLLTLARRLQPQAAIRLSGAFMLTLLLTIGHIDLAKADVDEAQVKSAFLYKFVGYIEWPPRVLPNPDGALVIGVLGADTIADNLAQLVAAHPIGGRQIEVRKLRRGDSLKGLHVIFIGGSDSSRLTEILAATKGQPILTVTESEQALALGSVINFVVIDDKVRFDVAPPPTDPGNLKVSARLLAVARKVIPNSS